MENLSNLNDLHDHHICEDTRTIYVGQVDREEDPIGHKSSLAFAKNIDYLNKLGKGLITVKLINVIGGDVGHGLAMFGAVSTSKSKVNIHCYGATASFGTILLQAASSNGRFISQHSEFMIHYGSTQLDSDLISAESAAEANKIWRNNMLSIYATRCVEGKFFKDRKYSISKIKVYINTKLRNSSDWYMCPDEALHYGFVDKII
jgi:ATP-dependent protease ClpP protease subunit